MNESELEILDPETNLFVDFTQFLTEQGLTITIIDKGHNLETLDGRIHRGRYAQKRQIDCMCHAMNTADMNEAMRLLRPEYITARFIDPDLGQMIATMFVEKRPASFKKRRADGVWWGDLSVTLVES